MSEEEEKQRGIRGKIMRFLPKSFVKDTAKKEIGYEEKQKKAISEQTGEDSRNGKDAGELGTPWNESFKKNE